MNRFAEILHSASEQIGDITRSLLPFSWSGISGIRGFRGIHGVRFWPTSHPAGEGTEVNYDLTRSLYRNDGDMALGSGFARPIIDIQVNFIGLPVARLDNEATSDFLNECISDHWAEEIQQIFRDSIRDSKVIVRLSKPDIFDPLMTLDEADHGSLEIIPPDLVDIERDARNKNIITRAVIHRRMMIVKDIGDPTASRDPILEEHDILEIITRDSYRFWDQTDNAWLDALAATNRWNFVPILEIFNEWDSALQGGQSDLEPVIPFMRAFHDVITQGLQAHRYHSTPKLMLKLSEVGPFIKHNFADAWDEETGQVKNGAEVSLNGREIIFFAGEDSAEFLEAVSVLGDTKTLAEFLIDCICIASQTPEWAFMRVDSGSANSDRNAQTVPLVKKIARKRRGFQKSMQELCKMILVANGFIPDRPNISWEIIRTDDEFISMQAFQQLVMGLEVARQSGEISDETYMASIRQFLPAMKRPSQEAKGITPLPQPVLAPPAATGGTPVTGAAQ